MLPNKYVLIMEEMVHELYGHLKPAYRGVLTMSPSEGTMKAVAPASLLSTTG